MGHYPLESCQTSTYVSVSNTHIGITRRQTGDFTNACIEECGATGRTHNTCKLLNVLDAKRLDVLLELDTRSSPAAVGLSKHMLCLHFVATKLIPTISFGPQYEGHLDVLGTQFYTLTTYGSIFGSSVEVRIVCGCRRAMMGVSVSRNIKYFPISLFIMYVGCSTFGAGGEPLFVSHSLTPLPPPDARRTGASVG